ncbi:MAG: NusG domain II-containing protein [Ruminococcus sp.]|nr:NusG domain II-containing protein [Ruminococcus sp.]
MKNKLLIICCAAVFLISGAVSIYMWNRPRGSTVEIISNGEVVCEIDLSREPDREITVEYEGRKNIIVIENGEIYVREAECPDHTCMKMGKLSDNGVPIVCMPNKLIIRYKGGGDIDAAA